MRARNTITILGTGAAALLSLAGTSAASAATTAPIPSVQTRHMGSCTASGDFAICEPRASTLNKPISITVHVWSRPDQGITGNWTMTCIKGFGAGSKSGTFHGRTPLKVNMKFPMRHSDSCTEAALASLNRSGTIHVWVTGTRS